MAKEPKEMGKAIAGDVVGVLRDATYEHVPELTVQGHLEGSKQRLRQQDPLTTRLMRDASSIGNVGLRTAFWSPAKMEAYGRERAAGRTDWSEWSPDKPHGRIPAIKPAAERATRTETMDEWRAAEMQRRRAKATAGGGGDRSRIPYRNAEGRVDPDATEEPNVAVKNKAPARLKVTVDAARDPSAQYDKAKTQHSE